MFDDPRDHAFTLYPYFNAVISSAKGCTIRDDEGKEYLDLASGQLSAVLGHSHPRLVEAVRRQAGKVVHLGNRFFGETTLEACREVASVCGEGLDKVVLCSTGSEANELAIRIARAATGSHELVGLAKGYYGCTHETLSMSDYVGFMKGLGVRSPGLHRMICPDCLHCPLGLSHPECDLRCATLSARTLEAESTGDIAAILVEPVLGSGGIIVPPEGFFQRVQEICSQYGALLIADEAQTGLGRTGRWMGMEHSGVVPDILVLSKSLGGGFPVSAVVTTAEIEQKCLTAPLANMSSHSFDPFGGAIAAEVIRILREEELVERTVGMGELLIRDLARLAERHPILANPRGRGLMVGLDVLSPGGGGEPDAMTSLALEAECLQRGAILGYSALSGIIRMLPPLTISQEELLRALEVLDQAATHIEEKGIELERYLPTHQGSLMMAMTFVGKLG